MKKFKPAPRPESRELQEYQKAAASRDAAFSSTIRSTEDYREAAKFADAKHAEYVASLC